MSGLYEFVIISTRILLRMRYTSDKSCRETQNTHFMFNNFSSKNRAVYEIILINAIVLERSQMATPCWITRNTDRFTIRKNIFLFSTATIVTLTRLNVTLSLHCLSCIKNTSVGLGAYRRIFWFLRIVSSGM